MSPSSTSESVLVDLTQVPTLGIRIIIINRPSKINAVNERTSGLLTTAFVEFEEDPQSKLCVFTGAGGNFCAGFDLQTLSGSSATPFQGLSNLHSDMSKPGPMGLTRLSRSKPVIEVMDGNCRAGGLELACWSSLRIVEENAQLGVTCRLRGVPLIDGGTIRLPALIGLSRANDLILTGRTISGTEAHFLGLANRLSKPGEGLKDSLELAKLIASHPQTCMKNDARSAREGFYGGGRSGNEGRYNVKGGEAEKMRREFELGMESLKSDEFLKALEKFFEEVSKNKLQRGTEEKL